MRFHKIYLVLVSIAAGLLPAGAEPVKYVTEDHLVPRNPLIDGALRPLLESKLLLTPADCAFALIRPTEGGELAVSVYSRQTATSAETYHVTVTKAEKNIDMMLAESGGSVDAAKKIRVMRCDAPISKSTALAIRAAWRVMLTRAEKSRVYARSTLHREELEFSLGGQSRKRVFAALPNKGGKSVSALITLAKQLAIYCDASVGERDNLSQKIEHDAKTLAARLEGRR